MANQIKIQSLLRLLALVTFLAAIYSLVSALTFNSTKNQLLTTDFKMPLTALFVALLGFGWWCVVSAENLYQSSKKKLGVFLFITPSLLFALFVTSMILFANQSGFLNSALIACGYIVFSGSLIRLSIINPEKLAKFLKRN